MCNMMLGGPRTPDLLEPLIHHFEGTQIFGNRIYFRPWVEKLETLGSRRKQQISVTRPVISSRLAEAYCFIQSARTLGRGTSF